MTGAPLLVVGVVGLGLGFCLGLVVGRVIGLQAALRLLKAHSPSSRQGGQR